jgi:hypothetical protein
VAEKFPSGLDQEGGESISAQIKLAPDIIISYMAGIKLQTRQCGFT